MARNILITGATGKTGSQAVTTLLERGHHVRALVHNIDSRSERLGAAGAEIVTGDLLDLDAVSRAAKGIDAMATALASCGCRYRDAAPRQPRTVGG